MRISDLVEIRPIARSLDLSALRQLCDSLDREGGSPSLLTADDVDSIVTEYLACAESAADPLQAILDAVVSDSPTGAGVMVTGQNGSGKTHFLCLVALLLQYEPLRRLFGSTHAAYEDTLKRLNRRPAPLVVPVALQEHRAEDEHLEDIIFDCVEEQLRRPPHNIQIPLSERSYALDLIRRHVLPRYQQQLDVHVRERYGGYDTWHELEGNDRDSAVAAAQSFAQSIGYPLDFRQSRVERIARLAEVIQHHCVSGIVWLIDDLWQFLAGAGHKAVRNDIAFLEFLGQRTKLDRMFVLVTTRAGLEELGGVEPYILTGVRDGFDDPYRLDAGTMRQVAHARTIRVIDEETYADAMDAVTSAYSQAFGEIAFDVEQLRASYPLHPSVVSLLESIYQKYFAEGDALVDFLEELRLARADFRMERDARRLVSLAEVFDILNPRLAAHPRASDYVCEVLDYYEKNASRIAPEHTDTVTSLAKGLILLGLANIPATVGTLVELSGLDEHGAATVSAAEASDLLEQMRLRGNYVDVRAGADGNSYVVDVHTNLGELARNRVMTVRSSLLDADPRLWRAAKAASSSPDLPLAHLDQPKVLEVQWHNTIRRVAVETVNLSTVTAQDLLDYSVDLASIESDCDCRVLIGELLDPVAQRTAYGLAAGAVDGHRFGGAIVAWLPRQLTESEMAVVRQLTACKLALREPPVGEAPPEVGDRIAEEAATLDIEVARITARAYREGTIAAAAHPDQFQRVPDDAATWADLLAAIVSGALNEVFPDFREMAPRRPLSSSRTVERLIDEVIRQGEIRISADAELASMATDILIPLGLLVQEEDTLYVSVGSSRAANEVMNRVRQRDKTAETERGRAILYSDPALHLAKSSCGLTREIVDLTIAALLQTGWLVALDNGENSLRLDEISSPLRQNVPKLARAPLLGMNEWRTLARVGKMVLNVQVPRPDHSMQTALHSGLLEARETSIERINEMRQQLEELQRTLGHTAAQWRDAHAVLDELEAFFQLIDPHLMPTECLKRLVNDGQRFLAQNGGQTPLARLLRQVDAIWEFLASVAPALVVTRDYLTDPRLRLDDDADLRTRRQRLLAVIGGGEQIIAESGAFSRLQQIFTSTYRRRYINWHSRCNRPHVFERYRTLQSSPELRALALLQRLDLHLDENAGRAFEMLEVELRKRCDYADLSVALDTQPVCPNCQLLLDVEPDLVPVEEILDVALAGVKSYIQALNGAEFQRMLSEHETQAPRRGELAARVERLRHLDEDASARQILSLFTGELIAYLNRVLSGQQLRVRGLGQLRGALAGRTMSVAEAQALFEAWLRGGDDEDDDAMVHIDL